MSWNNGYEKKKFEEKQKKQAEEYRNLGMTEEQIKAMYEFDFEQHKRDRLVSIHTQPMQVNEFNGEDDDELDNSLMIFFSGELTCTIDDSSEHSRYWWLEEIDNFDLAQKIKLLSEEEIEILTLIVFDGFSQKDAAIKMGLPYRTFKFKINKIKKILKNF